MARPFILGLLALAACSRTPPPSGDPATTSKSDGGGSGKELATAAPAGDALPVPPGATVCTGPGGPTCFRFAASEDAFKYVLAKEPLVLGVGEAHAQRGTEAIASSTKRFTEAFLPILAPKATDVVVELWAPDPKCMPAVKAVDRAQKPVVEAQAATNKNEYETLGLKAKAAGMTPWLLRPSCDEFGMLADAGADGIGAMLGLVKKLTQEKVLQLMARNRAADAGSKVVVAYGGALHNDLAPPAATKDYSFGPDLDRLTNGRFIELDLIVPEFIKKTPTWEKLAWFPAFEADRAAKKDTDKATLYVLGERSFTLVFPTSAASEKKD